MSEVQPVGGWPVRAAIARAAQATGVDFDYLLAQAQLESSLDPSARAGTSSAAGLYQFTGGTWLQTLGRHGADHGIELPASRADALAMRFDPQAAALMAGELANDNRTALTGALGRQPDAAELYLAHFLGSDGAVRLLSADPRQSAAGLFPRPAAANRTIFFAPDGAPRTAGQVVEVIRGKVARAMDRGGSPPPAAWAEQAAPAPAAGPVAREFHAAAAEQLPVRPSMAETLRQSFGGSTAPRFVRTAYDRLRGFGL